MLNTAPQAAAFWTALLLLLMVVLSFLVIQQRRKNKVLIGDGGQEGLILAGRTFGNAAEYIPAGIAALVLLTVLHASIFVIHLVGVILFVGRLVHAFSLSTTRLTVTRMIGMVLTFAAYTIAAITLLLYAIA
jgi:uncharacterized membrane protein YecN with MAPEG domain